MSLNFLCIPHHQFVSVCHETVNNTQEQIQSVQNPNVDSQLPTTEQSLKHLPPTRWVNLGQSLTTPQPECPHNENSNDNAHLTQAVETQDVTCCVPGTGQENHLLY